MRRPPSFYLLLLLCGQCYPTRRFSHQNAFEKLAQRLYHTCLLLDLGWTITNEGRARHDLRASRRKNGVRSSSRKGSESPRRLGISCRVSFCTPSCSILGSRPPRECSCSQVHGSTFAGTTRVALRRPEDGRGDYGIPSWRSCSICSVYCRTSVVVVKSLSESSVHS
ncbi:hypothetical protein R3P38DRAFT_3260236 [Favolaschia claudopus]|uniref:Secreted protein n=1 Tax=Favolaschia claudopus TaxID=2862362 RepID=A0AAW0CSH0_9AGAR